MKESSHGPASSARQDHARGSEANHKSAFQLPDFVKLGALPKRSPQGYKSEQRKLSLPKMLSGANVFGISDIERMKIGGASAGRLGRNMLHAL